MSQNVVVIGQGYVGLPLALAASEAGFAVTGLDRQLETVDALNEGRSHIDDISDDALRMALRAGYTATANPAVIGEAQIVVVCVPTPLSPDGGPDLTAVRRSAVMIGEHLRPGTLVILESTTYPGTTEEIFAPLINPEGYVVGKDIFVAFSPERIDPGNPVFGLKNTPKVVGGMTAACSRLALSFYGSIVDRVVEAKGAKEAEMAKLLENTFRHVNIALVNEMVRFCHELDIDLWNAIDCAETKPFGYMAFRPGPGVGGHCIPVDPSYLSHRVKASLGYAFRMVELAEEINEAAPGYVASRLWHAFNDRRIALNGARVLLVGVSYKPNISDSRETPAAPLARLLYRLGAALSYHDPFVGAWSPPGLVGVAVERVDDLYEAARRSDAVVLLQPHSVYDLEKLSATKTPILDTRGVMPERPWVERL